MKLNLAVSLLDAASNSYDSSINQYLDLLTERRTVRYVKLDETNVSKEFVSNEESLLSYYETNKDQFAIPEKRSYYQITFNKNALAIVANEEEVKSAYDQYLLNLPSPEKRVAHIMLVGSNYENDDLLAAKVAEIEGELLNIIEATSDKWIRPVDVAVAPDGSIFVTDWYDPVVGWNRQEDTARGRIFRIAPPNSKYKVEKFDYSSVEGSIERKVFFE